MTTNLRRENESLTGLLTADGELVTERLDHWASTAPDRTFLHYGEDGVTYSYGEFATATDAIAGNLAAHGVVKGDRVSVFSTNPLAATLLMFGIWKAGAVYAPVNFSFAGRLLAYQLDDTAPRLLVTDPGLLPAVNAVADQLTHLPTLVLYTPPAGAHDHVGDPQPIAARFPTLPWEALTSPAERPDVSVGFDDPANVVYTSGTTGPAKGVVQPLPLRHHEVATRFGIDIVTAGFGQTESGAPLGLVIEETPEGEGTPADLYRGLTRAEIVNRVRASGAALLRGPEVTRKAVMGVPTPFLDVTVLDEHDRPCPVGQPGQLAVRPKLPALIMSQYLGKPEATVTAWRNLWFHTGDAAVLQPDGMFDFVDRLGDRIRVRGENLSSFQVEDLLNQHERIQLTAAFAILGREGDEDDIVAYVVPIEGADLTEDEVRAFAEDTMPKYMRPRHIRVVPDVPRTPTNKIEKYKLRSCLLDERADGRAGS